MEKAYYDKNAEEAKQLEEINAKETKQGKPNAYYSLDIPEDYNLQLLSEANGMTLLVSEKGQVFWVKKTKEGEELVALNLGKNITPPLKTPFNWIKK